MMVKICSPAWSAGLVSFQFFRTHATAKESGDSKKR